MACEGMERRGWAQGSAAVITVPSFQPFVYSVNMCIIELGTRYNAASTAFTMWTFVFKACVSFCIHTDWSFITWCAFVEACCFQYRILNFSSYQKLSRWLFVFYSVYGKKNSPPRGSRTSTEWRSERQPNHWIDPLSLQKTHSSLIYNMQMEPIGPASGNRVSAPGIQVDGASGDKRPVCMNFSHQIINIYLRL